MLRSAERVSELQSRWELPLPSVGRVSVFPSVEPELALQLMWKSVFPSVEPELALQLMWESVLLSAGRVSVFPSVEPESALGLEEWVLQCE